MAIKYKIVHDGRIYSEDNTGPNPTPVRNLFLFMYTNPDGVIRKGYIIAQDEASAVGFIRNVLNLHCEITIDLLHPWWEAGPSGGKSGR